MNRIKLGDIEKYIDDSFKLTTGTEVSIYKYIDNKVLKIFNDESKAALCRLNEEGIIRLNELDLKTFNKPDDIVLDGLNIRGYTQKYLEETELDKNKIDFIAIKDDIKLLSENGFRFENIYYNYIPTDDGLYFADLTCLSYSKVVNSKLKDMYFKKNTETINKFLIGLLEFNRYRKDELTKLNQYCIDNHIDGFYGDYLDDNNQLKKCF